MGNLFCDPVLVTVGGLACQNPTLAAYEGRPLLDVAYNVTDDVGRTFLQRSQCGPLVVCDTPSVAGAQMPVLMSTGRLQEVTEVQPGVGGIVDLQDVDRQRYIATMSTMAPQLTNVSVPRESLFIECVKPADTLLTLRECPVTAPFTVIVCGAAVSIGEGAVSSTVIAYLSGADLETRTLVSCSQYERNVFHAGQVCANCTVHPFVSYAEMSLFQTAFGRASAVAAELSFRQCPPGNEVSRRPTDGAALCAPCAPGSSTHGQYNAALCALCEPGTFSNRSGAESCTPCSPGWYAPSANSTSCLQCSPNSYSDSPGRVDCEACQLNEYVVYSSSAERSTRGQCVPCPSSALCDTDGVIWAQRGGYVLIDQQLGTLTTALCSPSACVQSFFNHSGLVVDGQLDVGLPLLSASPYVEPRPAPQVVRLSGLTVQNFCDEGRWPAFMSDPSAYADVPSLVATDGHNVLCALCLPGYSQVNGRCIPCESTHVGALLGVVLLALLLVYLVHRLPHDWTGSATVAIVSNFIQMSTLFIAGDGHPAVPVTAHRLSAG